ncbi:Sugar transporter STL1 [Talaromyces islandicus]|uniref:Sugar transporter STL1 n=1 Tax=Talaromyces islandicus TaxID=28573 RepID=A0A0U1LM66_TALIS|nr:Sugar transporter STL1 [Talaromyces islandicus]
MILSNNFFSLSGKQLRALMVSTASMAFLLFGYDQGVSGGLLTLPSFCTTFPEMDTTTTTGALNSRNSKIQGLTVAIYEIGGAFGAILAFVIGEKLGRLRMVWLGHFIILIGAALQCASFSLTQFIIARIITGVGIGFNTVTIPVWQAESSCSHNRGKHLLIEGSMITGGVCLSYWVNFAFHYTAGGLSWRFPLGFQTFFAVIVCLVVLDLPESPRWLIRKGRYSEARCIMDALDNDLSPEARESNFAEACSGVTSAPHGGSSDGVWKLIMGFGNDENAYAVKYKYRHRMILAVVHAIFHQICGINLVIYYAPKIYQENLGLTASQTRIVTATVNGIAYFAAGFISTALVERIGRRKLMLIGSTGMGMGMATVAGTTRYLDNNVTVAAVAAAFVFVIQAFFAVGWLAIVWLYPAEIVPTEIRYVANSIVVATTWLFNFLIVMVSPVMLANIHWRAYLIFAVLNVTIGVCVYLLYPETARRSLEEIDEIFAEAKGPFDVVTVSLRKPYSYDAKGRNVALVVGPLTAEEKGVEVFEHIE